MKKLERRARFNEQLAAVGELAAGIAHEIRNPLASISGSVQVLSNELTVGSAERRLMEIIVSESNRLSGDPRGVPALRAAAGDAASPTSTSPAPSARSWTSSGSPTRSPTHTASQVDVRPATSILSGDRDQIRQIIYNVAKNAVRAMTAGGTLTVGRTRGVGAWYASDFADTGRGMSEDELARSSRPSPRPSTAAPDSGWRSSGSIVEDHGGSDRRRVDAPAKGRP